MVAGCYDRKGARPFIDLRSFEFATQNFDFWAPYKIGRNDAKTVPNGAGRCRVGRSRVWLL